MIFIGRMKRYQIAILSFAVGIFATTYFGIYFLGRINDIVANFRETSAPVEYETIQIFLSSRTEDPDILYCNRTYPISREVSRFSNNRKSYLGEYAYLALAELLKGPTEFEKKNGYFSSVNEGTKIQQIIIENGVALVDFNQKLNKGVAGSCKVQAIRSQIENTLKQFPEVKDVVISVDGEIEKNLQP